MACFSGSDGEWVNIYRCPTISAGSGASSWWCGDSSVVSPCDEEGTNSNPTKAEIFSLPFFGMLPQGITPWPEQDFSGCAVSQDNVYSVQRQIENATENISSSDSCNDSGPTSTTAPTASTASTAPEAKDCPNGAQIGEGVAIGLLALLVLAMAGWAFYERRQKNRLSATAGQQRQHSQVQQYYDASKGYASQYQSPHRPPVSEMDSFGHGGRPAHEMQS